MNFIDQLKSALTTKDPFYIKVKVIPNAPKNEITDRMEDGAYKIRVAAPALEGKANVELIRFLKKSLKASEVVVVHGAKERVKLIRIVK